MRPDLACSPQLIVAPPQGWLGRRSARPVSGRARVPDAESYFVTYQNCGNVFSRVSAANELGAPPTFLDTA